MVTLAVGTTDFTFLNRTCIATVVPKISVVAKARLVLVSHPVVVTFTVTTTELFR